MRIAVLYSGTMDGSKFNDFYDKGDYEISNVTHWRKLPEPPNF